jgi:hypothetical protein
VKAAVAEAIDEIRAGLPATTVDVREDADGGAYVIVRGVPIGPFEPSKAWVGFHITWAYPDADVYPHFLDPTVTYIGTNEAPNKHAGGDLPTAMSRGARVPGFDIDAIQISRRSNRRNQETDSALHKLLRVLEFLRSR